MDENLKEKEEAKRSGQKAEPIRGIYSTATYQSYSKLCKQFIDFVLKEHGNEVKLNPFSVLYII